MADPSAVTYIVEGVKISLAILEKISTDLPPPSASIVNLVQGIIAAVEAVKSNQELCDALRDRLLRLLPVILMAVRGTVGGQKGTAIPQDLKQHVDQFHQNLETILKEVRKIESVTASKRKRHKMAAFFLASSHATALQKCSDELAWAMREFEVTGRLIDAVRLCDVAHKVSTVSRNVQTVLTNTFLESLPRAKYAGFDCERPDKPSNCLQGTRTHLLDMIADWFSDPSSSIPRFFWLKGIAGVGKTTVARTVAELAQKAGFLGAQFFFSKRGEAELRNPALVFPTIAYQLARFDPQFSERITAALEADPEAPFASLKQQLDRLIIKPLSGLDRDPKRVVLIVLDAFDECEARGAKEILQLLVAAMPSLPFFLKILITSRPEAHITSVLDPSLSALSPSSNLRITALHDIEASIVKSDIRLYLHTRLRNLPAERNLPLSPDWVKDFEIDLLAEKAGNLFIHAATSIRFLLEALDLRDQMDTLLRIMESVHDLDVGENPFVYLDELYLEILRGLINPTNGPEVVRTLQPVLGSIVLLRDPLPVDALERLTGLKPGKASTILPLLQSVILPPAPPDHCPRIYHPSFQDFLQDSRRCGDERFRINTKEHEARLAVRCLELLNTKLHKRMLGDLDPTLLNSEVEGFESKVQAAFPPELQYACRYWASHVLAAAEGDPSIIESLRIFAAKTLLPWIEAMSWLGDVRLCLTSLEVVNTWVAKNQCFSLAKNLLNDGYRLLLAHFTTITLGAQQLPRSVLPLIPRDVPMASHYRDYLDAAITVRTGTDPEWPPCLTVLKGQLGLVNSVAFSPDGTRLASASDDFTIKIWDATSGSCLATLEGHSLWVKSAAFSPDGSRLVSGSQDETVKLWEIATGSCAASLSGHSDDVTSVAFSPDGTRVASGSKDHSVRVWDATDRTPLLSLTGHVGPVNSVAYSHDGSRIASASSDNTVRVWDAMSGAYIASLEGHTGPVSSVAFSPIHPRLASGSEDRTVRVWDTTTGTTLTIMSGHVGGVNSVAYSLDGLQLASGSQDETVRVWHTSSGGCLTTLRGHSNSITSAAFSPDGLRLASGSSDTTIRVWDTAIITPTSVLERHSDYVHCVTFSPDGTRLASGSHDTTIRVWDPVTGDCLWVLKGHDKPVRSVAFSSNGFRLASGSDDLTVRLWDPRSGICLTVFAGHANLIKHVAFSPSGSHITSTLYDSHEVYTWDVLTGRRVEALTAAMHPVSNPTSDQLELRDGNLLKGGASGSLLCIIPPLYAISSIDFFMINDGRACVALGSESGTVLILEVVLS